MKKGKRNGKQRYQCTDCGASLTTKNPGVKLRNQFVWFEKWILERQVYSTLVRDSGLSQRNLQNLFKSYLSEVPIVSIRSKEHIHLLIDGSYFPGDLCLILYYDYDIRYVQYYRQTNKEKMREIKEDLENLKKLGIDIYSVTCDGHKSILGAVRKVYLDAIIQRCLVHIKRQVKNYLSEKPQTEISRQLLSLSRKITGIENDDQANVWIKDFKNWYELNEEYICQTSINEQTGRFWLTHKNLHLAAMHMINAFPFMFSYLKDPEIPNTTNRLENYFSHLKDKLTLHRGLRKTAKKNFIKWYIHLKNQQSK